MNGTISIVHMYTLFHKTPIPHFFGILLKMLIAESAEVE